MLDMPQLEHFDFKSTQRVLEELRQLQTFSMEVGHVQIAAYVSPTYVAEHDRWLSQDAGRSPPKSDSFEHRAVQA